MLQDLGVAINGLRVTDEATALFGRTLVTLEMGHSRPLPSSKITPGDIVVLRMGPRSDPSPEPPSGSGAAVDADSEGTGAPVSGVVTKVGEQSLSVALDEGSELPASGRDRVRVLLAANDVTFRRYERALTQLRSAASLPCGPIISAFVGIATDPFQPHLA